MIAIMPHRNRARLMAAAGVLALTVGAVPARAEFIVGSGNLTNLLLDICLPIGGSEAFHAPSEFDRADWAEVLTALFEGDIDYAASLADWQQYDLIEFTATANGCTYYVLREQLCPAAGGCFSGLTFDPQPCRGLGTFVFKPHARRDLNIQVPHAVVDDGTRPEGIAMFLELDATFLQIAGTSRCSNSGTGCGGTTATCGGGNYRESDAAHYTLSFFQVASDTVASLRPDLVSVSVHGFSPSGSAYDTSLAQISNGTGCSTSARAGSIATKLAAAYNEQLADLTQPYPGRGGGSCQWQVGEPTELERVGEPVFCGGSNTQARSINGASDPCSGGVCTVSGKERFVHLEQQGALRSHPPGLPSPYPFAGISWQITIDAFADVFPTHTSWVDFAYNSTEMGSFCQPYGSIRELFFTPNVGKRIVIKSGHSVETPRLNFRATFDAYDGPVVIGR